MRTEGGKGLQAGELLEAIGRIDAVYVEEAERWQGGGRKKHAGYLRIAAAAACLLLVVGGTLAALRMGNDERALSGAGGDYASESGSVQEAITEGENAGGADEAAPEDMENGIAEEAVAETGGSNPEEAAGGALETGGQEHKFEIPEEIRKITVTHWKGNEETVDIVEGTDLVEFRGWAEGLVLGDAVDFAEEEAPGADADEIFVFRFGEQEASYYKGSVCYLLVGECWYPVENPADPPL